MYDRPYHYRDKSTPNQQNYHSFRSAPKTTPNSSSFIKQKHKQIISNSDPRGTATMLLTLDNVFAHLQHVLDRVGNFTPIDILSPYQITTNHSRSGTNDNDERDITPSGRKRVSTPNIPRRATTPSSRPITTGEARHRISFESEYYKLLGHYNALMQLILAKNNDINMLKYKLNEMVNTIILKLENVNLFDEEEGNEYDICLKDTDDANMANAVYENDQSVGPSEYNFQQKMDEISKKLMEIFNPQEEFESVTVDSTTVDSYILHKKKKLRN